MRNMTHHDGNRSQTQDKPRILLIEQHLPTAMSLVALLTQGGCDVEVATDSTAAMQMAQERGFDLIALDPDLADSGFETFLRLRQVPELSTTPIVFIARRYDDTNWRRGLELGAADYIERPLDGTAFMRRILSHVKAKPLLAKIP
jgi:DNA-binding response OmpR family regulator